MIRLFWVALTTVFIFCGCQSEPTFGQSATSAPQQKSEGLLDSVVHGVSSLLGKDTSPATPAALAAAKPAAAPTLADVVGGLGAVQSRVGGVETQVTTVEDRVTQLNRRVKQTSHLLWGLVGINGIVMLVVVLVALGVIGRPPLISDAETTTLRELRAIRKRQAKLTAAVEELQTYAVQSTEDREHFTSLLKAASEELKKLEPAAESKPA